MGFLSDFFTYEKETGRLIWKAKRPGPGCVVGNEAGNVKSDGRYRTVKFFGKRLATHRIIWELVYGEISEGLCIDHIDGNGLNNKIENLRATTLSGNQKNRALSKNNSTGINGVYKRGDGYQVRCAANYITFTKDFFLACCARKSAENLYGYHENNGRRAA